MLVAKGIHKEERQQGQHDGDAEVARHVGAEREERNQAEQVGEEDEEEHRQEIRRELVHFLFGDVGTDDAVEYHVGEPFHQTLVFGGLGHGVFLVHLGGRYEEGQQEDAHQEDAEGVLGERDVERPREAAVGFHLHQLAWIFFGVDGRNIETGAVMLIGLPFLQLADVFRREAMPAAAVLAFHDDGQPHAYRLALDLRDVEAIGIAGMAEDERLGVESLLCRSLTLVDHGEGVLGTSPCRHQQHHGKGEKKRNMSENRVHALFPLF